MATDAWDESARQLGRDAMATARDAKQRIEAHEDVCSKRYEEVAQNFRDLRSAQNSTLEKINALALRGLWAGLVGCLMIIGTMVLQIALHKNLF